ncbi:hypothetical protein ABEF95_016680 [Exophiala dermatitidis]
MTYFRLAMFVACPRPPKFERWQESTISHQLQLAELYPTRRRIKTSPLSAYITMLLHWRRDDQSCPTGQNYYRCSSVSYAGCCAHDPCGSGVCTDSYSDIGAGSCGDYHTVTVTQTVLQGAATSTVDPTNSAAAPASVTNDLVAIISATGSSDPSSSSSGSATTTRGSPGSSPTGLAPWSLAMTSSGSSSGPYTTTTLSSMPATTKTLSLVVASRTSTATKCPTSKPKPANSSPKSTTPPGTIAGSVIGSMAGLTLIILLLTWCFRRKKKVRFTFKRKTQTTTTAPQPQPQSPKPSLENELEDGQQLSATSGHTNSHTPANLAYQGANNNNANVTSQSPNQWHGNRPLSNPRSLDFGLPQIPQHSTAFLPKHWI